VFGNHLSWLVYTRLVTKRISARRAHCVV